MENNDKINYDTQAAKTLGDELRKHRTDAKIDIEDVASRLKLSAEQIDALEKGEYSNFPGLVFVSGYLRSYARFLKIDEQTITKHLHSITPQLEDHVYAVTRSTKSGLSYEDAEKQGFPKWILGAAALALAIGGVYFWQSKSSYENEQANIQNSKDVADTMKTPALKTDNVTVSEMTEDGKKEITNKPEAANEQAASAASDVVEKKPAVKVEKDELWIKVQYRSNLIITDKDGKVVFSRIVPAGSEHRLRGGAPYNVWIGIAAGSEANYGGTPIEPLKHRVAGEKSASFVAGKN